MSGKSILKSYKSLSKSSRTDVVVPEIQESQSFDVGISKSFSLYSSQALLRLILEISFVMLCVYARPLVNGQLVKVSAKPLEHASCFLQRSFERTNSDMF